MILQEDILFLRLFGLFILFWGVDDDGRASFHVVQDPAGAKLAKKRLPRISNEQDSRLSVCCVQIKSFFLFQSINQFNQSINII